MKVGISFESVEEAARYIALYAGACVGTKLYHDLRKSVKNYDELEDTLDETAALAEALRHVKEGK